ncbi:MAG: OsmC family protein [Planctomycetes bacterium]|nr:OsmC family protein [Planctomycetota bacterium]
MSEHVCEVRWDRRGAPFLGHRYARAHTWHFDGGVVVPASASPHAVPPPGSDPSAVDPEEALVAALSSCHMLSFLWLAAGRKLVVDAYEDAAVGRMGEVAPGRQAVTHVRLRPRVRFAPPVPPAEVVAALHHEAHEVCFIANSVRTLVEVEPEPAQGTGPGATAVAAARPAVAVALETAVSTAYPALVARTEADVATTWRAGGWTRKEILAHLLDSATANHDRFVRAAGADGLAFAPYDADAWVSAQAPTRAPWAELVTLWGGLNRRLVRVLDGVPAAAWAHRCRVGDGEPLTLEALALDYVAHLRHHLAQVLDGRPERA